jgi:hypothetical protein
VLEATALREFDRASRRNKTMFSPIEIEGDVDGHVIKSRVIDFAQQHGSQVASKVFNIPRTTISAWLAHFTRNKWQWVDVLFEDGHNSFSLTCPECGWCSAVMGFDERLCLTREILDEDGRFTERAYEIPEGESHLVRCLKCNHESTIDQFNQTNFDNPNDVYEQGAT